MLTYDQGYKDGGYDALSLGSFDWQTGVEYFIHVEEGTGGLPYEVVGQYQPKPTEEYVVAGTDIRCGPKD